jgi:hypothetical protein
MVDQLIDDVLAHDKQEAEYLLNSGNVGQVCELNPYSVEREQQLTDWLQGQLTALANGARDSSTGQKLHALLEKMPGDIKAQLLCQENDSAQRIRMEYQARRAAFEQSISQALLQPAFDLPQVKQETRIAPANPSPGKNTPHSDIDEWTWAPDGNGYLIAGLGERGHFARLKGLAMISRLVRSAGQPVPMVLLFGGAAVEPDSDQRSRQPAMDSQAMQDAYNQCGALGAEIENAEREGRTTEAAESRDELERLQNQLKAALGIRGKVRDLNDLANKLRPSIHGALARVYKAMRKANPPAPELANHLEASISSEGAAFVYRPAIPVTWKTQI